MNPCGPAPESPDRVSTLELFFDLVFVFTITQVSDLFGRAQTFGQGARPFLILTIVWWMYGGYAWLTNNVGTSQPLNRVLVLTGMAGFLIMALSIPQAFGRDGLAFGLAYLLVNLIHAALFTRSPNESARAIRSIAPFNIGTALLIVGAGIAPPGWGWALWIAAVALLAAVPFLGITGGFALQPAHFVERHGLVVLIAIGESVVSIGVGAAGQPVTPALAAAAVLALALTAALWWTYFDRDDQRAERALSQLQGGQRARAGLYAFGYAHLIMIAGVVLTAAGLKREIAGLDAASTLAASATLAVGIGLYLLGDGLFRRTLRIAASRLRIAAAAASLLSIPLGVAAGALAQIGALLLLLAAMLAWEQRIAAAQPWPASPGPP
jgi:low temperature requirement protein LtrA